MREIARKLRETGQADTFRRASTQSHIGKPCLVVLVDSQEEHTTEHLQIIAGTLVCIIVSRGWLAKMLTLSDTQRRLKLQKVILTYSEVN